jgi:hypothetical protein
MVTELVAHITFKVIKKGIGFIEIYSLKRYTWFRLWFLRFDRWKIKLSGKSCSSLYDG